jgi:hypothetical protein
MELTKSTPLDMVELFKSRIPAQLNV